MTYLLDRHEPSDAPEWETIAHSSGRVKRKRKCTQCGQIMPAGTRYTSMVGKEDGRFVYTFTCVFTGPDYDCPLKAAREAEAK